MASTPDGRPREPMSARNQPTDCGRSRRVLRRLNENGVVTVPEAAWKRPKARWRLTLAPAVCWPHQPRMQM